MEEKITDMTPNTLVIGPGGNKGFLFLGALEYLEEHDYLVFVDYFIGCSVGSLLSLLICLRFPINEIIQISYNLPLIKNFQIFNLFNNVSQSYGLTDTTHIITKLKEMIISKYGQLFTFKELYDMTGKELIIVSRNLTKGKTVYFNHHDNPSMDCVDAVKLSINMPFIYNKVTYSGEVYTDGAFGDPYPIDYYTEDGHNIIGLNIRDFNNKDKPDNIFTYIHSVVSTPIDKLIQIKIENDWNKTINVNLLSCSESFSPDYSIDEKRKMLKDGYDTTKTVLENLYIEEEWI